MDRRRARHRLSRPLCSPSLALGKAPSNVGDEPGERRRSLRIRPVDRRRSDRASPSSYGSSEKTRRRAALDCRRQRQARLRNLQLAQDAADGLLGEVADVDLADIPQMEPVRRRLLEKARLSYQQFVVDQADDPQIRWGAARSQVRLGAIEALLGDDRDAETTLREAAAELEKLAKLDPTKADYRRDLARSFFVFGVLLKDANRFREAEGKLIEATRLREEIAKLPDASSQDTEDLASSRYQLGTVLAKRGSKGPEAVATYRAALEEQERLAKKNDDQPRHRTQLARMRNNVGMLQRDLGELGESEKTFHDALELLTDLVKLPLALPAPRWQFARASNNLATVLMLERRSAEAGPHLQRAQTLLRKLTDEFPDIPQYPRELSTVEYNLGLLAKGARRVDEALASFKESARIAESLKKRFPGAPAYRIKLASAHMALADVFADTTPTEAEGAFSKALDEQSALLAQYPDVPEYQTYAAAGHYKLGLRLLKSKPAEAMLQAEQAKDLHSKVIKNWPDSVLVLKSLLDDYQLLVQALIAAGRPAEAAATAEQIPSLLPGDPAMCVHAAGLLMQCARAAPNNEDGRRQAEDCLARAVGVIRKAIEAKAIKSRTKLDIPEFNPLRDRDDFKRLKDLMDDSAHIG